MFYAGVQTRRSSIVLRAVLYRPDGLEHAEFTRSSRWINAAYDMALLRPYIGRWTLKLFLDDALVGTYPFVLADKARIEEFRRVR